MLVAAGDNLDLPTCGCDLVCLCYCLESRKFRLNSRPQCIGKGDKERKSISYLKPAIPSPSLMSPLSNTMSLISILYVLSSLMKLSYPFLPIPFHFFACYFLSLHANFPLFPLTPTHFSLVLSTILATFTFFFCGVFLPPHFSYSINFIIKIF